MKDLLLRKMNLAQHPGILSYALEIEGFLLVPLGMTGACAPLQDSNPPASVKPLATGSSAMQRAFAVCAFLLLDSPLMTVHLQIHLSSTPFSAA